MTVQVIVDLRFDSVQAVLYFAVIDAIIARKSMNHRHYYTESPGD